MAKLGLVHDYDLMANAEESARGVKCAVCEVEPTRFQWSDYYGEGMCTQCGCTYQLKGGTKEEEEKNAYPYMTMNEKFLPIAREYWQLRKAFVHYGNSFSCNIGMPELIEWTKQTHPEFIKAQEQSNPPT